MITKFIIDIFNFLVLIIDDLGYFGIFIGMMIESTIFPIPSEIILIPAGALIAKGEMSLSIVFAMAILGTIAGALASFLFASFFGRIVVNRLVRRYGKFLFLTPKRLEKIDDYFIKHGEITTFVGRLIPIARHLISLPAGFARMNVFKFLIYTILGAGIWSALLIYLGYLFWDRLEWINVQLNSFYVPILILIFIVIIIYILLVQKYSNSKK
jgi:membrane protein DedA with SNARE-associated domain